MDQPQPKDIIFRCPPELESVLPRPIPAVEGLPAWFKSMPQKAFSDTLQSELLTLKKCPPFIDAMTYGFLMPLCADLKVEAGAFSWEESVPGGRLTNYPRSPIDFHPNSQAAGTPFFEEDSFLIKFNNFWTIEVPPGYSMLITHPVNRSDLPFLTLSGLVDADRYRDNFINFPSRWLDPTFTGVLPKGTPVAQCVPVHRDTWAGQFGVISGEAADRFRELHHAVQATQGVYRRQFRASKR
jgi:hypothetical protein